MLVADKGHKTRFGPQERGNNLGAYLETKRCVRWVISGKRSRILCHGIVEVIFEEWIRSSKEI